MEIHKVILSRKAKLHLQKVPKYIAKKLAYWIEDVGATGLREVRKTPGYHDEPLKGNRAGQRSIRLNRAYRAIYEIKDNSEIHFVEIVEVNKHEY